MNNMIDVANILSDRTYFLWDMFLHEQTQLYRCYQYDFCNHICPNHLLLYTLSACQLWWCSRKPSCNADSSPLHTLVLYRFQWNQSFEDHSSTFCMKWDSLRLTQVLSMMIQCEKKYSSDYFHEDMSLDVGWNSFLNRNSSPVILRPPLLDGTP